MLQAFASAYHAGLVHRASQQVEKYTPSPILSLASLRYCQEQKRKITQNEYRKTKTMLNKYVGITVDTLAQGDQSKLDSADSVITVDPDLANQLKSLQKDHESLKRQVEQLMESRKSEVSKEQIAIQELQALRLREREEYQGLIKQLEEGLEKIQQDLEQRPTRHNQPDDWSKKVLQRLDKNDEYFENLKLRQKETGNRAEHMAIDIQELRKSRDVVFQNLNHQRLPTVMSPYSTLR